MEAKIFSIKQIGLGQLYIMPCPKPEYLAVQMKGIRKLGVDTVVSLLEKEEALHLGMAMESQVCESLGLHFESFPIRDRGNPASPEQFRELVDQLHASLHNGRSIVIHCYAGIGRTGLLAGSLLIQEGMSVGEAVELMSDKRGRNMPQTQDQYEYLQDFAEGNDVTAEPASQPRSWLSRWLMPA